MKSVETENDMSIYRAKDLMDKFGLNCLTLHAATLSVKDEIEVHRAVYYGKISADFACKLSAPIMVVHSNVSRKLPKEQRMRLATKIFKEIKPYAESLGLKLALENLSYASGSFGKNIYELKEIYSIEDNETMGFTLDFWHATATGVCESLLEEFHERLLNVHLSNRAHKPFLNAEPGLLQLISDLKRFGCDAPMTLELNRKCTFEEISTTKKIVESAMGNL